MADPNVKIDQSVGGPESATAQSSNAGERGTSAGKGVAGDTGGEWRRSLGAFRLRPGKDLTYVPL